MPGPTLPIWPGITATRGFDFTFSPGVTPSVCIVHTVPHTSTLAQDGSLFILTGGETPIHFPDCKLEAPQLDVGQNGAYWRLPILDRRWKWQFGFIYGSHNIRKPDGTYIREKTPQEIATLLFQEMGEANADVSRLPNDTRPECNWTDGAEAAAELEKLCYSLGCVVVLNHINNRAEVWPIGSGAALPTAYPGAPISGRSFAPVRNAAPFSLRVDAGPTLFQDTFVCDPVGLDRDGKYRHIDDLQYLPPGANWSLTYPPSGFPALNGLTYTRDGVTYKTRDLAEAYVFRTYRIRRLLNGTMHPTFTEFSNLQPFTLRDYRLYDELVDEDISSVDGGLRKLPARVFARHYREDKKVNTELDLYQFGFSFDTQHGIIHFNDPVFIRTLGFLTEPAEVRIECSFNCGLNGIFHRLLATTTLGGVATPQRVIQRPEIQARVIQRYGLNGQIGSVEENVAGVTGHLAFFRDAAKKEYDQQNGGTLTYQKLMRTIQLDGLTTQITWSGGGGRPPTTTVSQAQRHNRILNSPDQYRERLVAKQSERKLQNILAHEFGGVIV